MGVKAWLLAAVPALVLTAWASQPAAAGVDLSRNWNASYSLTCTAAITQVGDSLTADTDCGGGGLAGTLMGTLDSATSSFSLTGEFLLISVAVEGTASSDGSNISGSFSYFPLVADGAFSGVRAGMGDSTDLTGNWNITIADVFSGECQLAIEQAGSAVSAMLDCGGSLTGTLEGTIDTETGGISLSGSFSGSSQLDLDGVVAKDGQSIAGTWALGPSVPLSGTFDASRAGGPPGTPTSTAATPTSTAMPASLPETGTVTDGGQRTTGRRLGASLAAIVGAAALVGAAWQARKRLV